MADFSSLFGYSGDELQNATPLSQSGYTENLGTNAGNWLTGSSGGDSIFNQMDSLGIDPSAINVGGMAGGDGGGILGGLKGLLGDSDTMNALGGIGGAVADLGGLWQGMQSLDLAKDIYKDQSEMSKKNYAAQRNMTNAKLEAQHRARLSSASAEGRANLGTIDQQMAKYGIAA